MRGLLISILILGGCTSNDANWRLMTGVQRDVALEEIATKCQISRSAFKILSDTELGFYPAPNVRYESVDCALAELKRFKGIELGFIGNEAVLENAQ